MVYFKAAIFIFAFLFSANALSLGQAQNQLFSKNLDILIANQEYCKKYYELSEAKAVWYPSFDASASYTGFTKKNTININLPANPNAPTGSPGQSLTQSIASDRGELAVDVSYPVTMAFVNMYSIKYRDLAIQTKFAQNAALKNQLSFKLGTLFFQWDFSFAQTQMQKLLVSQYEEAIAQFAELETAGMTTHTKVLQAHSRLENARLVLSATESTLDSLRIELVNFIQSPDSACTPESYSFQPDLAPSDTICLNAARPEIVAMDLSVSQLTTFNDILTGQKYPNLIFDVGWRYGKPGLSLTGTDFMGYGVASAQLKFNIFDGFKVSSQKRQNQTQIEIIQIQKQQLINSFTNNIKTTKLQLQWAKNQEKAAMVSLDAAQAFALDAKNSLASGTVTALDFLDAQNSVAQAKLAIKQAEFMQNMTMLKLNFVAGKELIFK